MDVHQFTKQAELVRNGIVIWHEAKISEENKKSPAPGGTYYFALKRITSSS